MDGKCDMEYSYSKISVSTQTCTEISKGVNYSRLIDFNSSFLVDKLLVSLPITSKEAVSYFKPLWLGLAGQKGV